MIATDEPLVSNPLLEVSGLPRFGEITPELYIENGAELASVPAEVLARGGSRPALESFIAFRGRPPQIDALLRHNGMSPS